jgi:hypothetical protein
MKMRNHVPHYSDGGREPRLESACLLVGVAELTSGVIYSGSTMDIREFPDSEPIGGAGRLSYPPNPGEFRFCHVFWPARRPQFVHLSDMRRSKELCRGKT